MPTTPQTVPKSDEKNQCTTGFPRGRPVNACNERQLAFIPYLPPHCEVNSIELLQQQED